MPTRIVTCPDCGTAVPYGRLSCVACGSLLASVAGTRQPSAVAAPRSRPGRSPRQARRPILAAPTEPQGAPAPEPAPVRPEPVSPSRPPEPVAPAPPPEAAPVAPALQPLAARAFDPAPLRPASLVAAPAGGAIAGAYLPPSAVFAVAADAPTGPARITQPIPRTPVPSPTPARPAPAAVKPGRAPLLADFPVDAPDDVPTWLVAVGSAIAALSFVLPWGENGMIGGGVDGGFFSSWGLANAANVVPLVAALIALWLQLAPGVRRTPVRTALVGFLLGGPLAGVAFVYAASPFGLGTGGVGVVAGALLLMAGGGLALRSRHAVAKSAV